MSQGKRLTSAQQQRILDLKADGSSVRAIAKKLELSKTTVQAVLKRGTVEEPEPPTERTKEGDVSELKRETVRRLRDKLQKLLDALSDEKIAAMSGRDLAIASGIASDKLRQWTGLDRDDGRGLKLHIPDELTRGLKMAIAFPMREGNGPRPKAIDVKAKGDAEATPDAD